MAEDELRAALDGLDAPLSLWWRDDDAGRPDPRLERLLALAQGCGLPLALAVVPAWIEPGVAETILLRPDVSVLQHGIAHQDHAGSGAKRIELGGTADPGGLRAGLVEGLGRLGGVLGGRCLPVLVPPWNRISPALVADLPALGFRGLSTFGGEVSRPAPGLVRINTHLDLVAWREDRRPLTLGEACAALARLVRQEEAGPLGILTHHLVMDEAAFRDLGRLLGVLCAHPKVRFSDAGTLFMEAG